MKLISMSLMVASVGTTLLSGCIDALQPPRRDCEHLGAREINEAEESKTEIPNIQKGMKIDDLPPIFIDDGFNWQEKIWTFSYYDGEKIFYAYIEVDESGQIKEALCGFERPYTI